MRILRRMRSHIAQDSVPNLPADRLLMPEELARFLGVPVKTLYQWRYRGVGPRGVRVGRHVRYRRQDVDDWLERLAGGEGRGEVA